LGKTHHEFENEGVLNPAAYQDQNNIHLFYRAVRKGNNSTIGYCRLNGPLTIAERWDRPILIPEYEYESKGIEDARVVKIDDLYYLTYTGYDGTNALGALATSRDLRHFLKRGIIVPSITCSDFVLVTGNGGKVNENYYKNPKFNFQKAYPRKKVMLWDKDVLFFPRRINGKLVFLHRIRPGIQIVSINNLQELTKEFWDNYLLDLHEHIALDPVYDHESSYIGSGCPPIETKYGWLMIYHGVKETVKDGRVYNACASLLDLDNPVIEIARLPYALFVPEYEWELKGEVNNVVFPTGTSLFGDTLYMYYGAADERIATASVSLSALLKELIQYPRKDEKRISQIYMD